MQRILFSGFVSAILRYALTDFLQTFVARASWDKDELTKFGDQKVKGQGHQAEAYRA